MARRGSNIYKRKDGRYEGRIPVGYREDGKIKYKSVYSRSLAEVKEKMAAHYAIGQEERSLNTRITFREVAEQWLLSAKLRVKPSSYANYTNIVNKHLLPELGGFRMAQLTTAKMDDFVLQKLHSGRLSGKGGLSAKSVRDIMTVFRSISAYSAREYGTREAHFTMPKTEHKKLEVLTCPERTRLQNHLLHELNRTSAAVLLCMYTGLRVGEICGLKWSDFDFMHNTVSVSRTVQRVNLRGRSEVVIGTPKSRSSVRVVPFPVFLSELLRKFSGSADSYFVTGTARPTEPRTMQNRFKRLLAEAGVRQINFHMLRHTYATVCIEQGFDPKTLSELLGHADASVTLNRYVHSSMQLKQDYVSRLRMTA